ncbi:MAG: serine/threonine-protein kinase PknK, partial [Bradymonadaceae bacterium]
MSILSEGTTVAGRFIIAERIGEGGMGAVYRALQTSLDREVALKVLHSEQAFTARARRRFGREARAIARLNHPHIAGVFDFGTDHDDQTLWLAMELVAGHSLSRLKRQPLNVLRIVSLTDQILSALSAAHARGIIHRDLKPSNILLAKDNEEREIIKLVDFGLAATQSGDLDLDNAPGGLGEEKSEAVAKPVIMGTPRYMAPELFRRLPADPRVDLYALGVILYEIFAGTPPYPGDDPRKIMRGHLREPIPQLRVREGDLPALLERCIYTLLAKDPADRYETAAEVRDVMQNVIGEYSYVPWMVTGPSLLDPNNMSHPGNVSAAGFLSNWGAQTMPPALAMGGGSRFGANAPAQAPLIGRETERRNVEKYIRSAVSHGHGSILFVEGEAGVGKSRLVQWIRVRVEEAGVMKVASGNYSRTASGFHGVRSILEEILGTRDVGYDELPHQIEKSLKEWGFSDDEIDLCVRLMQPGGDAAVFEATGPASERRLSAQESIFALIERILRQVASQKPWLLIIEDIQFASDTTFSFLQHLAVGMHLDPLPVVILSMVRSEELDQAPEMRYALERLTRLGPENVARIKLKRLELEEATDLVSKLAPLDRELAEKIARRASGNPLHVTQILRYLQESSKLLYENGEWKLADDVDIEKELPDELAELMRYRLKKLAGRHENPEPLLAILQRAAILGQSFDYRLLHNVLTEEPNKPWIAELDTALEIFVREGFLREVGKSGQDVMEFDHLVMRDVILQDLEGRRGLLGLHKLAAEAKTAFYGKRSREYAMEIIDHYRRAREPAGVYAFTVKAARVALDKSDLMGAVRLYRDAKQLVDTSQVTTQITLPDEISEVLTGAEVALEVAHLERRLGEYDGARENYRRILSDESPVVSLWARWGLGELAHRQGDFDEALGWYEAARREAQAELPGLKQREIRQVLYIIDAYCLFGVGSISHARGRLEEAQEVLSDALARAQKAQERLLEAQVLRHLTDVVWRLGDAKKAEVFFRRASILEESHGDQETIATGLLLGSGFLREVGQSSRAEQQAEQARQFFEELGKFHHAAHCLLTLGHIAWCRGEFKTAANHYRQAHRHYETFSDRRGIAHCNLHLAMLALSVQRL